MDPELKSYLNDKFKDLATKDYLVTYLDGRLANFATKDDLKNLVTKEYLDQRLSEFATKDDFAELWTHINETIAVPLQQHIEETKDYPLLRRDVHRIKKALNMAD